jgi:hypothetical protein
MNPNDAPPQTRKSTEQRGTIDTRLHGYMLVLARAVWLTLFSLILIVFFMGIPAAFKIALSLRPETVADLDKLGLPASSYAIYIITLDTVTMLVFACIAVLIVWRRSDDWMVMFVSLMLLLTAMLYTAPAFEAKIPLLILALLAALAEICQVAFVYLFPDGRFVPRWMWILLLPLFVWRPAIWGLVYLPNFFSLKRTGENFFYVPQDNRDIALFLSLLAVGIIAQVYRYLRHSTPVQRQQTKWLIFGIVIVVLVLGTYVLAINTLPVLHQPGSGALLVRLLSRTINHLALILIPLTLTLSILRYRLWDIDTLINRTLVYGTLTGALALVYSGCVIALQFLLRGFTGGSDLAIVGSTLAIAALFQPLRRRIQHMIDRRFYRNKYDAARTLEAFSVTLHQEVDLDQLREQLLAVVQQTMQPAHVALWLRPPEPSRERKMWRLARSDEVERAEP